MIDRDTIVYLLHEWGRWQRSAKTPRLNYSSVKIDAPARQGYTDNKYMNRNAERLDKLLVRYMPPDYLTVLELTFVENKINADAANVLKCSQKTFTNKRAEAIAALQGAYSVARDYDAA